MGCEKVEEEKVIIGLSPNKKFQKPEARQDFEITNSDGRKIKMYRFIDKEQAFFEIDAKRKKDREYRA